MPVAGQDAVLDGAAMQGEAHVRAAIVEGEDTPLVEEDQHGPPVDRDDLPALALQLLEGTDRNPRLGLGFGCHDAPPWSAPGATPGLLAIVGSTPIISATDRGIAARRGVLLPVYARRNPTSSSQQETAEAVFLTDRRAKYTHGP